MLVSVVIPTKNRPIPVAEAVQSILDGEHTEFELFVIDQSTDDLTRESLLPFFTDTRFHYLYNKTQGVGAASSRNIGVAISSGELVAITDDDVHANPDWLKKYVDEFEKDSDLDFACGSLVAPPRGDKEGYTPEFQPDSSISRWRLPFLAAGANFCMRRRLFERVGGYDECCGPGSKLGASDDGDITFRILRSGAKWKAVPDAIVVHVHGHRPGKDGPALLRHYQGGIGGNYGRFTRRGDLMAGLFFWSRESLQFLRAIVQLINSKDGTEFVHIRLRIKGFWRGLLTDPNYGFVNAVKLLEIRQQYLSK